MTELPRLGRRLSNDSRMGWLGSRPQSAGRFRHEWATLGAYLLAGLFLVLSGGLWLAASRSYFVKPMTESHNILLAAYNVRDFLSFVIQDVAPSPDPLAHPYWYIHHPNLLAKCISLLWLRLGVGLEGQTGFLLVGVAGSLCFLAAGIGRISRWGALAAVAVAFTSYGAFHFSAGDLCRGPLYLLLFPVVFALVRNPTLDRIAPNVSIAACVVLGILSDWGFAAFLIAFLCAGATYGRKYVPWRWAATWVIIPAIVALCAYEAVVIYAVGWQFFLLDMKVTYLGRIGAGTMTSMQSLLGVYRQHHVVIWPAHSGRETNLFDVIAVLASAPILNSGPAWLVLGPFCALLVIRSLLRLGIGFWGQTVIGISSVLGATRLVPLIVLLPALFVLGVALRNARVTSSIDKLAGLTIAVLFGILGAVAVFPAFTLEFTIAGGRPPAPLLEMLVAATFAELAMSGVASRYLRQYVALKKRRQLSLNSKLILAGFVAVIIGGVGFSIISADGLFYGLPKAIALGFVGLMVGSAAAFPVYLAMAGNSSTTHAVFSRRYPYAILGLVFICVAGALSTHVSSEPVVLGRYSPSYAAGLAALVLAAGVSFLTTIGLTFQLLGRGSIVSRSLLWAIRPASSIARRQGTGPVLAVVIFALQAVWLSVSIVSRPPAPIPYAKELEAERYKGRSFLTTGYDAMAWYSTKGWAYMPASNPPNLESISLRYRNFADWSDSRKYGHPDYFLCDNTGFAYIRVSPRLAGENPACGERCTCHDVAKFLQKGGNTVEVDRPDYAVVKLHWPRH